MSAPVGGFTVLMPVHRPPSMLPLAIESVLAQTWADFDLVVICDGAPPETAACAQRYADRDPRVRVLDLPKGERHGEAHRDDVLQAVDATARPFVAQLADDDLWFPGHLAELRHLLADADFGHLLQAQLQQDGSVFTHVGDLADPAIRERMLEERFNFFGPSVTGYRLSAYRALERRWSPAPPDVWTDLHMWRSFLQAPGLRLVTRFAVQGVTLSTNDRPGVDLETRAGENRRIAASFATSSQARADFRDRAFADLWRRLRDTTVERDELLAAHDAAVAEIAHLWDEIGIGQQAVEAANVRAERWRAKVKRLRPRLAREQRHSAALAEEIAAIRASRTWRWTARLRRS